MPERSATSFNRAIAAEITKARRAAGLSQRQLSERLERAPTYMQKVEAGALIPGTYELTRITRAIGVSAAELMARIEKRL